MSWIFLSPASAVESCWLLAEGRRRDAIEHFTTPPAVAPALRLATPPHRRSLNKTPPS
jgi:hypothetical protein